MRTMVVALLSATALAHMAAARGAWPTGEPPPSSSQQNASESVR
jgi:hypothetical protein